MTSENRKKKMRGSVFFGMFVTAISQTLLAPLERVRLLLQSQEEMVKYGRLDRPYNGVADCAKRVLK